MHIRHFLVIAIVLAIASCNSKDTMESYLATADSTQLADLSGLNTGSRKILRTADMQYRVANVINATMQAEKLVTAAHGMVVKSQIQNSITSVKNMPYTSDSLKRTQVYTPTAQLVLKVPAEYADTLMQQLGAMAQFTESRTISQQDLTYAYLSNALKNEKAEQQQPAKGKEASVLASTPEAIAQKDARDEAVVDRRVQNLQLLDEADYATITVAFVQPEMVDVQTVINPEYATRTPFGTELQVAGGKGLNLLRGLVLFAFQLWPLWLMAAAGIWLYRILRRQPVMLPKKA